MGHSSGEIIFVGFKNYPHREFGDFVGTKIIVFLLNSSNFSLLVVNCSILIFMARCIRLPVFVFSGNRQGQGIVS